MFADSSIARSRDLVAALGARRDHEDNAEEAKKSPARCWGKAISERGNYRRPRDAGVATDALKTRRVEQEVGPPP